MPRGYYRAFITLLEDAGGYSAGGRPPQGRCVIEAWGGPCRVSIYVQDLKPLFKYKVFIIKNDETKSYAVCLGGLEVTARGRGEARYECDCANVGGYGFPVEDYCTAAVVIERDGTLITPLLGSKEGAPRWIRNEPKEPLNLPPKNNALPNTKKEASSIDEEKEADFGDTIAETASEEAEALQQEECTETEAEGFTEATREGNAEELPDVTISLEESGMGEKPVQNPLPWKNPAEEPAAQSVSNQEETAAKPDPQETFKTIIQRFNREIEELSDPPKETPASFPEEKTDRDGIADSVEGLFAQASETPVSESGAGRRTRISLRETSLLPLTIWDYEENVIIASAYRKYGYLIAEEHGGVYSLGIPDEYEPENETGFLSLGYIGFVPENKGGLTPGSFGYWIKQLPEDHKNLGGNAGV